MRPVVHVLLIDSATWPRLAVPPPPTAAAHTFHWAEEGMVGDKAMMLLAAVLLLLEAHGDHVTGHVPRPDVLAFDVVLCRDLASFARAAQQPTQQQASATFFFFSTIV